MNYLVHLYLSGPDHEHQLGGLMGDFIKGSISTSLPEKIALGLHLHRRIDCLAQNSPHHLQSRRRLHPKYSHGRGIIIDIFYDHFLASNWVDYSPEPLETYAARVYRLLQEHHNQLPRDFQKIAVRMAEQNWLVSYRNKEVVGKALQRIAQRLSRPLPLAEGTADLVTHEVSLRQDFKGFMTEAIDFVKQEFGLTVRQG